MKKGQAAMEFLMTYGWAILVVLVAIGALAYFGVLDPGRFLPRECTLFPGLDCSEFKVTDDASPHATLIIRNGMGEDLSSVTLTLVGDDKGGCTSVSHTGAPLTTFSDGDQQTFNFDCTGVVPSGSRFKSDITVAYTSGGLEHSQSGQIVTEIE